MQVTNTDVRQFHMKHGFPCDMNLSANNHITQDSNKLMDIAEHLKKLAEQCKQPGLDSQKFGDERMYRAHLMIEELSEVIMGLSNCDEIELADATADLRYVTLGTDVTYGIPSNYIDREVHNSNMTKQVRSKTDPRMKDKGPEYRPPDIKSAIELGRSYYGWINSMRKESDHEIVP